MGTNYYLIRDEKPACECCKRPYEAERLHIGKSSGGWCFSLHVGDDVGAHSLDDWRAKWAQEGWRIEDEYGRRVTENDMLSTILARSWKRVSDWTALEYMRNHAEPGPNGLLRHRIDGRHCIGHGAGTYDLITGDFS